MKLTIKRSEWLRGEQGSRLVRQADGKKCCLGFYGIAKGLKAEEMVEVETPETMICYQESTSAAAAFYALLDAHFHNTDVCEDLIEYNDNESIADDAREHLITTAFASIGVQVEFVD